MKKEKVSLKDKSLFQKLFEVFDRLDLKIKDYLQNYLDGTISREILEDYLDNWLLEVPPKTDKEFDIPDMIEIQGGCYRISLIRSLEREEKYSYSKNKMLFNILINKTENDNEPCANKVFSFETFEEREKNLKLIQDKLTLAGRRFI